MYLEIMKKKDFKFFYDVVAKRHKTRNKDLEYGCKYDNAVEFLIGNKVYTCKAYDFLFFNEKWNSLDEKEWDEGVGYNNDEGLMFTNTNQIQAMRIYKVYDENKMKETKEVKEGIRLAVLKELANKYGYSYQTALTKCSNGLATLECEITISDFMANRDNLPRIRFISPKSVELVEQMIQEYRKQNS